MFPVFPSPTVLKLSLASLSYRFAFPVPEEWSMPISSIALLETNRMSCITSGLVYIVVSVSTPPLTLIVALALPVSLMILLVAVVIWL